METRPNLFHFATSELSQDAVLCWMLSWAKPEHQAASAALHQLGVGFLGQIFKKAGKTPPPVFSSVEVRRQAGHIDVLCLINGTTAVLIEDKTRSKQHSEQLPRYVAHVSTTYDVPVQNIIPVYIQTGGQSDYREVTKHGYLAFGPPPSEFQEMVRQTKTAFTWRDTREYEGIDVNNIVRHIIEQTLETRLKYSKCLPHPNNHRLFYLRSGWSPDGKIHYIGRGGKKTYKRIEGRARIWKQGVPKEVKHFFGFELKRWRLNDQTVAFQIRPTLVFAEPNGQLILDARVGSLRRRLTKMWYNAEWVNRLLAATQVISSASPIPGDGLVLESTTLRIQAPTGIREEMLVADPAEDEIAEDAVPELPEEDDEAEKAKEAVEA